MYRIKGLFISSDCILDWLSQTKPEGGKTDRVELFQATRLLITSNMPQIFFYVSLASQPH